MAATGRVPVTKGTVLGLEEAGIELGQRGHINVNEKTHFCVEAEHQFGIVRRQVATSRLIRFHVLTWS